MFQKRNCGPSFQLLSRISIRTLLSKSLNASFYASFFEMVCWKKKILFAWFGLKNVLCNPEELVEHVKICNSELSLYRDHFFFYSTIPKSEHLLFLVILLRCLVHPCIHYTTYLSHVYVINCLFCLLTRAMVDLLISGLLLLLFFYCHFCQFRRSADTTPSFTT